MKHKNQINTEFVKEAMTKQSAKWEDLSYEAQKEYLQKHKGSKKKITKRPGQKGQPLETEHFKALPIDEFVPDFPFEKEITWENRSELQEDDIFVSVWFGKNSQISASVGWVSSVKDHVYPAGPHEGELGYLIGFRGAPGRFIPEGYHTSGGGGLSISEKRPNYPRRFFKLGHEKYVPIKIWSPQPGNTGYDLMH